MPGDVSSALIEDPIEGAWCLVAREPLVAAGVALVERILEIYQCRAVWNPRVKDGDAVDAGAVLGRVRGRVAAVLVAERVILNFLQLLSGIATLTARFVEALGGRGTRLLDTRKTPPGYRYLAKWAFACGGGYNHRFGLWDRVMLKDNHLAAGREDTGMALSQKVAAARSRFPELPIEVEVDRLEQIGPVLDGGADVILLDNFTDPELAEAVARCRGRCLTEASGGIGLDRLAGIADLGLDFISTGAPIHQARWVDIGMDVEGGV